MIAKREKALTANGKEVIFNFGLGALGLYFDNVKKDGVTLDTLSDKMSENPFSVVPKLMYFTAAYGYIKKGEKVPFTVYDVADWIDEDGGISGTLFSEFIDAFSNSLTQGAPKPKVDPETRGNGKKRGK